MTKGIADFLREHASCSPVSFHMPGHKGRDLYMENGFGDFLEGVMDWDITEIPGADNLFQPEDRLAETMEKYKNLYGSKKSYLLINGSSAGILASILTCVSKGGKLIIARNSHKSAFNALQLGDITPLFAYPDIVEKYGIMGEVTVEEIKTCMDENPDAEAVILPSPNYYGICSDIEKIAKEVHKRGKTLIVDQAHGAHLKFFGKAKSLITPAAAEDSGADIVINSTHKTLGSFTQTAVMNVCSERVNRAVLEDKLQILQSSSPSYPLMASLDINADLLIEKGDTLIRRWSDDLKWFYEEAEKVPYLDIMKGENLDATKINIDMSAYGVNGNELEEFLMDRGIFIELVAGNMIMCMTGIGNKRQDYVRLLDALKELASLRATVGSQKKKQPEALSKRLSWHGAPVQKEYVALGEAAGRVCASSVIPYPPGIPIVCSGEIIDEDIVAYIKERRLNKEKVIGVTSDMKVAVGKI